MSQLLRGFLRKSEARGEAERTSLLVKDFFPLKRPHFMVQFLKLLKGIFQKCIFFLAAHLIRRNAENVCLHYQYSKTNSSVRN